MRALPILVDPVYTRPARYTAYERFWLRYINDARDLPFIKLLTGIHYYTPPFSREGSGGSYMRFTSTLRSCTSKDALA
jgi:hypothetical protein